jgi:hypothetical protein
MILCKMLVFCINPKFKMVVTTSHTVNREILVMVLFWPMLAPKYEVPKLNTAKYVTLQKLTTKIEHCLNIFLYLYSLVCTFLSYSTTNMEFFVHAKRGDPIPEYLCFVIGFCTCKSI